MGNCAFNDDSQEKNLNSLAGQTDYAWNCLKGYQAQIRDELYTIVSSLDQFFISISFAHHIFAFYPYFLLINPSNAFQDGFSYVFLCNGNIARYYDAKSVPEDNNGLSLWSPRGTTDQTAISPGYVELQLLWEKIE